jgi:hypothetical protein
MSTVVLLVTKSLINHERVMERIVITTQIFDDGQKSMMDGNCSWICFMPKHTPRNWEWTQVLNEISISHAIFPFTCSKIPATPSYGSNQEFLDRWLLLTSWCHRSLSISRCMFRHEADPTVFVVCFIFFNSSITDSETKKLNSKMTLTLVYFSFFVSFLLCVFTFSVPCCDALCDFRCSFVHKTKKKKEKKTI